MEVCNPSCEQYHRTIIETKSMVDIEFNNIKESNKALKEAIEDIKKALNNVNIMEQRILNEFENYKINCDITKNTMEEYRKELLERDKIRKDFRNKIFIPVIVFVIISILGGISSVLYFGLSSKLDDFIKNNYKVETKSNVSTEKNTKR